MLLPYNISIRAISVLFAALCVAILVNLGFWQLRRADQKRHILAQYQQSTQHPMTLQQVSADITKHAYHNLQFSGHLLSPLLLLDNRFYQHQLGYEVIALVQSNADKKIVLVDRGWIPRQYKPEQLIKDNTIPGTITFYGRINPDADKMITFDNRYSKKPTWPMVIQKVDFAQLSQLLHKPIYPFVLMLDAKHSLSFKMNWQPVIMSPARHTGYAVQWFALAIGFVIAWLAFHRESSNEKNI